MNRLHLAQSPSESIQNKEYRRISPLQDRDLCKTPGGDFLGWPIRGGSTRKGYLFQASAIWKGTDFTLWSIRKGREICHLGLWKGLKGRTDEFYGFIKSRKHSVLVIDSYLNDSAFAAVKRDAKFLTRYVKRVQFVNRKYTKGVPFSWKMVYKRVRGWMWRSSLLV